MASEQERLGRARTLIQAKKYQEARSILEPIKEHPTARQWLARLDQLAPPTRTDDLNEAGALNRARELISQQKYDEARVVLESIGEHPTAQQWLARIDSLTTSQPPDPDAATISQAKILIKSKQYGEARKLLERLPANPTAQELLQKLNERFPPPAVPAPDSASLADEPAAPYEEPNFSETVQLQPTEPQLRGAPPSPAPGAPSDQPGVPAPEFDALRQASAENANAPGRFATFSSSAGQMAGELAGGLRASAVQALATGRQAITRPSLKGFVNSDNFRKVMAGTAMIAGFMLLFSFFFFSWLVVPAPVQDEEDGVPGSYQVHEITALELWLGSSDNMPTLDFQAQAEAETVDELGFGDVRLLDRLLILIPFLAGGLMLAGWMFWQKKLETLPAMGILVALVAVLFIFPYAWELLSNAAVRGDAEEQLEGRLYENFTTAEEEEFIDGTVKTVSSYYDLGEHRLYAFLALLVTGGGLGLLVANRRGMLDEPGAATARTVPSRPAKKPEPEIAGLEPAAWNVDVDEEPDFPGM
jgi:hypothetical protein